MAQQLYRTIAFTISISISSYTLGEIPFDKYFNIAVVNVAPGGFRDEHGILQGAYLEIAKKIADEAGFTYTVTLLPYPRLVLQMKRGNTDMSLLVPNEQLNKIAIPLSHIVDIEFILVGLEGEKFNSIEDIQGKKVGYLRGSNIVKNLIREMDVLVEEGSNYENLMKMLISNRIDAIIVPELYMFSVLKKLNYPVEKLAKYLSIYTAKIHLVYARKNSDKDTIAKLTNATEKLKREKVIQSILDKYNY